MSIYIPEKIKVGYRNRIDTYNGKLAYVVYFDSKGKLRKEKSWEGWRDNKLEPDEFDNIPTAGFVLNKKVGDYSGSWGNHRQAYSRIYDPRGFEFEITINNLLFILENSDCIRGKGLQGEFVYSWSGTDLLLLPTNSPDYKEISVISNKRNSEVWLKGKDLKVGGTYLDSKGKNSIYLGRFDKYETSKWKNKVAFGAPLGKHYFFFQRYDLPTIDNKIPGIIETYKSLTRIIIETVSEEPPADFASLMEILEESAIYSPVDENAYVYNKMDFKQFYNEFNGKRYGRRTQVFIKLNETYHYFYGLSSKYYSKGIYKIEFHFGDNKNLEINELQKKELTLEKWHNNYEFYTRQVFLMNGKELK